MSASIKRFIITLIPEIVMDWHRLWKYRRKKLDDGNDSVPETFSKIHDSNFWKSEKSLSGTGSDLIQTEVIRAAIPEMMRRYSVTSMLDIPCGDFNWMKHVNLRGISYLGGDIVEKLVRANTLQYGSAGISFRQLNLLNDRLPKVDLIFCRDCLVHFSYQHIQQALANIKGSGSQYLLTTSFVNRRLNFDIRTGDWRPINLSIKPFYFPEPVEMILERCTEGNGKSRDKSLLLYRVADLPEKIPST